MKMPVWTAALLLLLLPLTGMAKGGIAIFNATCPGNLFVHAGAGGPVYVNGRETSLKRFNDNYFEARDAASATVLSISRAPDGSMQLSYTGRAGAHGVCSIGRATTSDGRRLPSPSYESSEEGGRRDSEVTCESNGRRQVECDMDTRGDVRMVNQLSRAGCKEGLTWGLNRHSVWVSDGCRAVFRNVSKSGHYGDSRGMDRGPDATLLGACNVRARAQGALVTKVPVNDDVMELIVDYPDGRFLCMVRNDGLVQSLTPIRKHER